VRQFVRWSVVVAALALLFGLAQSGMLASLDRRLGDWRLGLTPTEPTGSTVVVEIDSKSLAEIGVWPWPRTLHADLLDRLMDAGANDVVFDIDFSSASDPAGDAALAAALERAGGYAYLAAFGQGTGQERSAFTRPLDRFTALADPVLVNVLLDPITGRVHSLPVVASDDRGTLPSLALQLAQPQFSVPAVLEIDLSLDVARMPRLSYTDVLYGRVDPAELAGKQVIVGAGAIELRDFFQVPLHGIVSGPMVQALALETLKQGRILANWGHLPGLLITAALALVLLVRGRTDIGSSALALLALVPITEALAHFAYVENDLIVNSASMHVGLFLLFALALADNGYDQLMGRRAALKRLRFLATHDDATGLLSRQGMFEDPSSIRPRVVIALQPQGMDDLRATLGHELVEKLLLGFAARLPQTGFAGAARIAPATFALLGDRAGGDDDVLAQAQAIARVLSGQYRVDDHLLHVEVLAGCASGDAPLADLVNQAETALVQARADRVGARGFSAADQQAMARRRRLDHDLRGAIAGGQLRLLYQPQLDLKTRALVGAETLLRWEHPELGSVSPAEFIPLAEETGLIVDLGRWVMEEACREASTWPAPITVAVNVSPVQFQQSDIVDIVQAALDRSGLPSHRLEVEITESSRVTDPALVSAVMWRLQSLGVRLSVDDFGTGYSSLAYLRDLPFETVKIDQSFVRDRSSPQAEALLAAIVELARHLGKATVAEGIEDEATAQLLTRMGCTYGQGYLFSRPIPASNLRAMMAEASAPAVLQRA
jgi:EAL domain-containing protein (putative c-di-GMP-specific phosphodiesterase class I)/CHASE2 domain-containing sensor protein/GGDEF domain-containing protein